MKTKILTKLLGLALTTGFLSGTLPVLGQTNLQTVMNEVFAAQNNLVQAAADYQSALQGASAADIQAALNALNAAAVNVTDPAVQADLGKIYAALSRALALAQAKTQAALNAVNANDPANLTYAQKQKVIGSITIAAGKVSALATLAKKPLILSGGLAVFGNSSSANMYKAGQLVTMRVEYPAGCATPEVTLINNSHLSNNQVVDASTLSPGPNGTFSFKMGTDWGGATVQVVACGVTNTTIVYNYGKAPIAGLPDGFPQDLPKGTYVMTMSGTITTVVTDPETGAQTTETQSIPGQTVGTFELTSLSAFAKILVQAFDAAIASVSEPGCSQSFGYSPFSDNAFTATYTVTCASGGSSATSTINFTLTKK